MTWHPMKLPLWVQLILGAIIVVGGGFSGFVFLVWASCRIVTC